MNPRGLGTGAWGRGVALAALALSQLLAQAPSGPDWRALEDETMRHFQALLRLDTSNPPGNERLTWLKRAVWLAADRPGRVGFVPAGDAHWWHVSTFSRAVVTDMGEAGFRLRQRDRAKAKELARRGARALARLRSEGPAVAARFRAEHGRLTSRENWARLYEDA